LQLSSAWRIEEENENVCAVVYIIPGVLAHRVLAQEHDYMNEEPQEPQEPQDRRDHGFAIGLLTGTVVGAGLAIWLVPRLASELRQRITDSGKSLGKRASEQYQQASTRVEEAVDELTRQGRGIGNAVGETIDELTRQGQTVRDDVAEAVARSAHRVEGYATAAKSDRVAEARKQSATDRSATKRSL
jgi:gas vesicle protein